MSREKRGLVQSPDWLCSSALLPLSTACARPPNHDIGSPVEPVSLRFLEVDAEHSRVSLTVNRHISPRQMTLLVETVGRLQQQLAQPEASEECHEAYSPHLNPLPVACGLQILTQLPQEWGRHRQPDFGRGGPQPGPLNACLHALQDRERGLILQIGEAE